MKRILIDLTDIEQWQGTHGGTQRVVYGITRELYLARDRYDFEIGYIAFSSEKGRYHHTDFEPIYGRVESQKINSQEPQDTINNRSLIRLKQALIRYTPARIRSNPKTKHLAKISYTSFVKVSNRVRNTKIRSRNATTREIPNKPVNFQSNDTVLILGKPWDNLNIQKNLQIEKSKTGFTLIQVVYDLIIPLYPHLHHPALFKPYTQNLFEAACNSDVLLPISQSSDRDFKVFCKELNIRPPITKVIRLGENVVDELSHTSTSKPDSRIQAKFIICVGTIEIRKNHSLLYYAYKLAAERGIDVPQLVIVGSRGWLSGDMQHLIANDSDMKDKIIILDSVNDAGLDWLYKNCQFTVYPSMYEGWGLPVAESLAYGKNCVASNISSIPEIAGELIDYFSPYDSQECLNMISKYCNDQVLHEKEAEIISKYKVTSWATTTSQIIAVLKYSNDKESR